MIWAVKVLALNKKDGKGKDLIFTAKKSLPTKIRPEKVFKGLPSGHVIPQNGHFLNPSYPLP